MLSALFFRLLAAIFSRGYGWHDDQFLVIEIAQSWVDGIDYYSWLPSADGTNPPEGFSFFYVGLHYLLFRFFEIIGIIDPQTKRETIACVRMCDVVCEIITCFLVITDCLLRLQDNTASQ